MNAALAYELEKLEGIITAELLKIHGESIAAHQTDAVKKALREEAERIKKKFVHEIFGFEDERHLERYIQLHQQELIRLTDLLASRIKKLNPESESDFTDLYQFAGSMLEGLLEFIERHFTKYFDQDTKAPESYIILAGSDLVKGFGDLQDQLKQLEADPYLIELALHPLKKFIENIPSGQISYRKIIYVKEVHKELSRVIHAGKRNDEVNEDVRLILLYLNFNTIKYFRYYTNYVNALLREIDSASGRIERLSYLLKTINQTQVKPEVGYNRAIRTLKDQLVDWISEEIFYLEKMYQINEKNLSVGGALTDDFKLRTEMSVSQLAYLLKVFIETKIIHNKNVSELIRFFSRFFQTKRLENISYESFRVRYYNTEDSTKRSVRNILLLMVDHINKN
ncbi:MAG: hypothetical protein DI539_14280 [Flavobacterium psychrophilum]|nr:MAG: hypothetical protein DI539_14280 [Flavobacterium psychrophilum]